MKDWSPALRLKTTLRVFEPEEGDSLTHRAVYIAPADGHMTFDDDHISLDHGAKEHHKRPTVDPLFTSAASAYVI